MSSVCGFSALCWSPLGWELCAGYRGGASAFGVFLCLGIGTTKQETEDLCSPEGPRGPHAGRESHRGVTHCLMAVSVPS